MGCAVPNRFTEMTVAWRVSYVCRRWRSVILSPPKLWTSIIVCEISLDNTRRLGVHSLLSLLLERSKKSPLTISIRCSSGYPHCYNQYPTMILRDIFNLLSSHLYHVHALSFIYLPSRVAISSMQPSPQCLPRLPYHPPVLTCIRTPQLPMGRYGTSRRRVHKSTSSGPHPYKHPGRTMVGALCTTVVANTISPNHYLRSQFLHSGAPDA